MKTHFILHTLRKECTHCLKIHFISFSQQSLQLQGIDRDCLLSDWLATVCDWVTMSKMYVQIGGAFLGESGESADSLPAAMWKSRSRRNQVTFYNIFDSWSVLYFKIMTYKSSLSRILWRRSVLSWTLPSYQTQAGAEYLPVIVPSTESLPVSKPLQWSSLSSSVKPLKWPKVSLLGKLQHWPLLKTFSQLSLQWQGRDRDHLVMGEGFLYWNWEELW